jgi:class 3 adenylate cyclase/predicted ATPase
MRCNTCGTQLFEQAKFCWECGTSLAPTSVRSSEPPSGRDRERRSLTVMFCDLVGSTRLAHRVDPEELHDIISRYQSHCVEAILRHQGHVAQFLGDGVLVYFGYPVAHEDAALRASRAGVEIIEGLDKLNRLILRHYDLRVAVRIGIHRGLVVIGEIGAGDKREVLAVGETTNIAAKLQSSAEPNSVIVSAEVERLIRHEMLTEPCLARSVEGTEEPIVAHRVRGQLTNPDTSPRLSQPLVARAEERSELERLLERSAAGTGQAALLIGVPGIGKSRLLGWLEERVLRSDRAWLRCRCSAYTSHTPLAPLIQMQRECFGFARSDAPGERLAKLGAALAECGLWTPLAEALLASLHSLTPKVPAELAELSPELQRRRTLELCVNWLLAVAGVAGLVFVVDDLHWIDPTTDELCGLLRDKIIDRPVLLVGATRPEFESAWWPLQAVHRLELSRLASSEVQQIVSRLGGRLPPSVIERIVARSDGVPLFAEEMSLAALESEDPTTDQVTPPTIQDLLQSRLDRLGVAKGVAQVCAVIGADASPTLISRVTGEESSALAVKLDALVRAQLMTCSATEDGTSYNFRHALIRDTAYDGLLKSQRRQYHGQVAQILSEQAELVQERPEMIAYHYSRSEQPGQSVSYWLLAGQLGVERSSMLEAIEHLASGLRCLESVPLGQQRLAQELQLRTLLGVSSMAAFGYANEVVGRHQARAAELCEILRAPAETFPVTFGLWVFSLVRSDRRATTEFAQGLLVAAQTAQNSGFLVQAQLALTLTKYWGGEFTQAVAHADRVLALYDPEAHADPALSFMGDARVYAYVYRGLALYFLGFPDSARESLRSARQYAAGHPPFTRVGVGAFETQLLNLTGEAAELERAANETLEQSREQGFPLFLAVGVVHAGWARVGKNELAVGSAQIRAGIAEFHATGATLNLPYFELHLAQAQAKLGEFAEALALIDGALLRTETSLDTYYVPELLRCKAELELGAGMSAEGALVSLRRALAVARAQKSRALELRVLCTLLSAAPPAEADAAKLELGRVYGSYTEGHATRDLRAAKLLLEG